MKDEHVQSAKTYRSPYELGQLAADAAALLPERPGRWAASAGRDDAGRAQATLQQGLRRIQLIRTTDGIRVQERPFADEPGGDRTPAPATTLPMEHVDAHALAAEIAREHLGAWVEPSATAEQLRLRCSVTLAEFLLTLPEEIRRTARYLGQSAVVEWEQPPATMLTVEATAVGRILLELKAPLAAVERTLRMALPPQVPTAHRFAVPSAYARIAGAFPVLTPSDRCEEGTELLVGLGTGRTVVNVFLPENAPDSDDVEAGLAVEADLDLALLALGQI
ncbi:hypothetical protein [Kitasatospora griseola]|uniref:hypothetical protein n=1 Tax=Kitasatospora griseola TaxID=2064 RepID=UPI00343D4285